MLILRLHRHNNVGINFLGNSHCSLVSIKSIPHYRCPLRPAIDGEVTTEEVISNATIRGIFSNQFQITGLQSGEARELALLLRGKFLVDVQSVTKVEGMAFLADEVEGIIDAALDGTLGDKEIDKAKFARLAAATVETGVGANL